MGDSPKGPFAYGGTLVDLGDLYLDGRQDESHAANYLGNTHGGMVEVDGQWYIFYHRQTNRSFYARQACAEKLERTPDGGFCQAEVTSCGLNAGPLSGIGRYEARIACNLWGRDGTGRYDCRSPKKAFTAHPYFTQTGGDREGDGDQYIANMRDGAVAGFKYFAMERSGIISVTVRGNANGKVNIYTNTALSEKLCEIPIEALGKTEKKFETAYLCEPGVKPLFFYYEGYGAMDFISFEMRQ